MNGNVKMKKVLFVACIFIVMLTIFMVTGTAHAEKVVALFPFVDESGYRGPWDLTNGLPRALGFQLDSEYFIVIPYDTCLAMLPKTEKKKRLLSKMLSQFSNKKEITRIPDSDILEAARKLKADLAIIAVVKDYNYSRFKAGSPLIGGYGSYKAQIELNPLRIIRVIDGKVIDEVKISSNERERGLGLQLLGKPRQSDLEFVNLDKMDFGSREFYETLIGLVTLNTMKKAVVEIRNTVARPDMSRFKDRKIYILNLDRTKMQVHINVGLDDAIEQGMKFGVFTEDGVKVGRIIVTQILAAQLSLAEIIEGTVNIRKSDLLRPE